MEWQNFRSFDSEGDKFIIGMMRNEERWKQARKLFTAFIEANGFTAWHIHDGWVMSGYNNGSVLHNEDIRIVWINEHAGYSHVSRCPDVGEKIIIIKNSPDGDEIKPFDLYCYDVIEKPRFSIYADEIRLQKIDVKQAVFNQEKNHYELHIKKESIWSALKRKFHLFTDKPQGLSAQVKQRRT